MRAHDERRAQPKPTCRAASRKIAAGCAGVLALACSKLTEPSSNRQGEAAGLPAPTPNAVPARPGAAPDAGVQPLGANPSGRIEVSHILVSYQGASRARPTVTRTRHEASELAATLAARASEPGADFAELAKDASDAPSGVDGGTLPAFERQQMTKPFSDAAFALGPGEVSGVVETRFGFHVIKRIR